MNPRDIAGECQKKKKKKLRLISWWRVTYLREHFLLSIFVECKNSVGWRWSMFFLVTSWRWRASNSSSWQWRERSGSLTHCVTCMTRSPSHRLSSSATPRERWGCILFCYDLLFSWKKCFDITSSPDDLFYTHTHTRTEKKGNGYLWMFLFLVGFFFFFFFSQYVLQI